MTVSELIEKLKEMPQDAPVMARGYEDGMDDVVSVEQEEVALDYYNGWYCGRHESLYLCRDDNEGGWNVTRTPYNKKMSECETRAAVYLGTNARGPGNDER